MEPCTPEYRTGRLPLLRRVHWVHCDEAWTHCFTAGNARCGITAKYSRKLLFCLICCVKTRPESNSEAKRPSFIYKKDSLFCTTVWRGGGIPSLTRPRIEPRSSSPLLSLCTLWAILVPQVFNVAANIWNKQSLKADNVWSSSMGVGRGANKSSP